MPNETIEELIEKANSFHAYVGVYLFSGPDPSGRIGLGSNLGKAYEMRRKYWGVEGKSMYLIPHHEDKEIFSLWDYVKEGVPTENFYKVIIDTKNRIGLPKELVFERIPLILCGKRDHIRVYSQADWERIQEGIKKITSSS